MGWGGVGWGGGNHGQDNNVPCGCKGLFTSIQVRVFLYLQHMAEYIDGQGTKVPCGCKPPKSADIFTNICKFER